MVHTERTPRWQLFRVEPAMPQAVTAVGEYLNLLCTFTRLESHMRLERIDSAREGRRRR